MLALLYPPSCVGCGQVLPATAFFCEPCDRGVERLAPGACPLCAEPGAGAGPSCARCRREPPPFERAYAPLIHEGPVARAIHRFKYEDCPELARPLAQLLAEEARSFLQETPALLVPIPLHVSRYRERRYDQVHLLAGSLAQAIGRPCLSRVLTRSRATPRQVGLDEADRAANVQGAFTASPEVAGASLLLLDDVYTTGATAKAATLALLGQGAKHVEVLALARAHSHL